ncbi:hypothetical protein BO79DRAFT_258592 [Aspergillus costaricaensis CBS 115574]|uniref:Uncharacterized protein n=1 Tax=Aspergillus costaricaensis CBS 115574 TaxID=1448317 RepID=A0ACD1I3C8_9EURO|nr:hypothetical protein BO79DRAFT_258592 [Aspergillus costaricaensis CBS 115574]RAK85048.1 hypothetical protein BO79DRAFT_258592 [Aspergillus costaricaensis CBS 115574]
MPATPNSVSPSIPGPWWTAMVSYVVATCFTAVLLGTIADFACRKAIVEFSISRHADTAQELQELAGWTPPGTETARAKEGTTESEHSKSDGEEGEKGKEKKPTDEGGAGPSQRGV